MQQSSESLSHLAALQTHPSRHCASIQAAIETDVQAVVTIHLQPIMLWFYPGHRFGNRTAHHGSIY
jgi:hypothetical protein